MRRVWWFGLVGSALVLAACETDEGSGGTDGGADAADGGGDAGALAPLCSDDSVWNNSCLSSFFDCFDPAGTCAVETRPNVGDSAVEVIVWESGAEWEARFDNVTGIREDLATDSSDALCSSTSTTQGPDGERNAIYSQVSGTLRMEIDASGNMRVTCPDTTEEVFTATERAAAFDCLGARCGGDELFME